MLGRRSVALCVLVAMALTSCTTGPPIPPAYTQDELAERCVRTGGWWHGVPPDSLFSGFCEYSSPGILR
jgi:hypothetical protein